MNDIQAYNNQLSEDDKKICELLLEIIENTLSNSEKKVWHRHPVWFQDGNPIVGYTKQKAGVQLLFWSGQTFEEESLIGLGKFKAAGAKYGSVDDINIEDIARWIKKAESIQWDYKNIVKNKGVLNRLK